MRSEGALVPGDIAPTSVFEANSMVDTHRFETGRFVKADTGWVRQGDAGVGILESLELKHGEKPRVQGPGYTLAMRLRAHVGRDFDRPGIGRALSVPARVGIPKDTLLIDGNEPGETLAKRLNSPRHLGTVRGC